MSAPLRPASAHCFCSHFSSLSCTCVHIAEHLTTLLSQQRQSRRHRSRTPEIKRERDRTPVSPPPRRRSHSRERERDRDRDHRSRSPAPRRRSRSRSRSPRRTTEMDRDRDRKDDRYSSNRSDDRFARRSGADDRFARRPPPSRGGGGFDPNAKAMSREIAANEAAKRSRKDCRVYVGNLPFSARWNDLKDFMREGGSSWVYSEDVNTCWLVHGWKRPEIAPSGRAS